MFERLAYRLATALILAFALLGCTREEGPVAGGEGYLDFSFGAQAPEIIIKSTVAAPADMGFALEITGSDGKHNYSIADSRTIPAEGIRMPAGIYDITASSLGASASPWGSPSYSGSARVTVKPEQKTTAAITCKLTNTIVSVDFDESITSAFSSYSLSVDNGGTPLVFSNTAGTQADTAYFAVTGVLNYSIQASSSSGSNYSKGPVAIDNVKAGRHYKFVVSTKEDGSFFLVVLIDGSKMYNVDSDEAVKTHTEEISMLVGDSSEHTVNFYSSRGLVSLAICHEDDALELAGLPRWTDLVSSQSISALQAAGFECSTIPMGSTDVHTISFGSFLGRLAIGNYTFKVVITDKRNLKNEVVFNISVVPPVESKIDGAKPWAHFAVLQGEWVTSYKPEGLRFQYSVDGSGVWTDVSAGIRTDEDSHKIAVDIFGLQPGTKYICRTVTDSDLANGKEFPEISFTTDANVPTIPNISFDAWYKSSDAWYPDESGQVVWDTANPGTASLGVTPTTPEESDVVSGKAVRMESTVAGMLGINKFAAGNIYLGQFGGVTGMGAKLNWGYPFKGRPVAIRGYYKYKPVAIDYAESPYTGLKGQPDWGSIRVFLCDWTSQFVLNTNTGTFLQEDDPSVIAYSGLYFNVTNSAYVNFTLPIQYRDNRQPTYIEIACASSRYGDYFTGGKGSVLLIDEFELIYDPAELTEAEREAIGYR